MRAKEAIAPETEPEHPEHIRRDVRPAPGPRILHRKNLMMSRARVRILSRPTMDFTSLVTDEQWQDDDKL